MADLPRYCVWGVHHNMEIFASDADVFRPERWFEAQGEQLQKMDNNMKLIFGYGRFECLGKNVAFMELNKVFVEVCQSFLRSRLLGKQGNTTGTGVETEGCSQ